MAMSQDEMLQYTQGIRLKAVGQLIEGDRVPTDTDSLNSITKLLDGMDRQALTLKRIAAESEGGQKDRDTALMIATMSEKLRSGNPFRKSGERVLDTSNQLPTLEAVEGQMDVGRVTETYADFIKRVEPES